MAQLKKVTVAEMQAYKIGKHATDLENFIDLCGLGRKFLLWKKCGKPRSVDNLPLS